jgi:hypothetical protein
MKAMLIGSRALNFWNSKMKISSNTDWDIISTEPIEGAEWHRPCLLNNADLERFTRDDCVIDFKGIELHVVNPWGLSAVKRSHLWRNISFQKHITHYHRQMIPYKRQNYNDEIEAFLQKRIELTMKEFPQGYPKLNKSVQDFFDDYVVKKYDHDYLHEIVAYYDKPLYTRLQSDPSKAWCERDLWDKLSLEDKTKCVAEEASVIAIERFLVPRNWEYSVRHSYLKAIDKICTTLCSGWFRDHAIDYYPEVNELFCKTKFENIRKELNNGN